MVCHSFSFSVSVLSALLPNQHNKVGAYQTLLCALETKQYDNISNNYEKTLDLNLDSSVISEDCYHPSLAIICYRSHSNTAIFVLMIRLITIEC